MCIRDSTMWLPSSGGMGSRLKKKSEMLIRMARVQSSTSACSPDGTPRESPPVKVARTMSCPPGTARAMTASTLNAASTSSRFDTGPANVTRFSSRIILRKLREMMGVGLAQPISMPPNMLMPKSGPKTVSYTHLRHPTLIHHQAVSDLEMEEGRIHQAQRRPNQHPQD